MEVQEEISCAVGNGSAVEASGVDSLSGCVGHLLELLDRAGPLPDGWMIHCFGGSKEVALELLRRGAYLSFSERLPSEESQGCGGLTMRASRAVVAETDAPDLLPVGVEGPHNEEICASYWLVPLSCVGESEAEVASMTTYQK